MELQGACGLRPRHATRRRTWCLRPAGVYLVDMERIQQEPSARAAASDADAARAIVAAAAGQRMAEAQATLRCSSRPSC